MGNHGSIQRSMQSHIPTFPKCISSIIDSYITDCDVWDGDKLHHVDSHELKDIKNIISVSVNPGKVLFLTNGVDFTNLETITGSVKCDSDMSYMFYGATSFNGDISSWDVSGVTNMSYMFCNTRSFNGDLSSWDVSNVANMAGMFYGATSFNGDLSSWNVSSVTNMGYMFYGTTFFNDDLSSWDVSSVLDMNHMFSGATAFDISHSPFPADADIY